MKEQQKQLKDNWMFYLYRLFFYLILFLTCLVRLSLHPSICLSVSQSVYLFNHHLVGWYLYIWSIFSIGWIFLEPLRWHLHNSIFSIYFLLFKYSTFRCCCCFVVFSSLESSFWFCCTIKELFFFFIFVVLLQMQQALVCRHFNYLQWSIFFWFEIVCTIFICFVAFFFFFWYCVNKSV